MPLHFIVNSTFCLILVTSLLRARSCSLLTVERTPIGLQGPKWSGSVYPYDLLPHHSSSFHSTHTDSAPSWGLNKHVSTSELLPFLSPLHWMFILRYLHDSFLHILQRLLKCHLLKDFYIDIKLQPTLHSPHSWLLLPHSFFSPITSLSSILYIYLSVFVFTIQPSP